MMIKALLVYKYEENDVYRMHISEYPCLGLPNYLYVANQPSLQYFIEHDIDKTKQQRN